LSESELQVTIANDSLSVTQRIQALRVMLLYNEPLTENHLPVLETIETTLVEMFSVCRSDRVFLHNATFLTICLGWVHSSD
jgi:hypothetical protein